MSHFSLTAFHKHPLAGFVGIGWHEATAGAREPTDIITFKWDSGCGVQCSLMRAWEDFKVHGTYGGADMAVHALDNVFASVYVLQCQNVFPYAFCVCSAEMRGLCSHVCLRLQEVRNSCTRPRLVSVRILCSLAPTRFRSVFLSFFCFPSFFCSWKKAVFAFISYTLSLLLYHRSPLAHALPHPWLVLWQRVNCACSHLTGSCLIKPPCQFCTRLPKEERKPCSPLIQQEISAKGKQIKKAATFNRRGDRKRGIRLLQLLRFPLLCDFVFL